MEFCPRTQCAVLIASIYPTERAVKETFDKDGNRR